MIDKWRPADYALGFSALFLLAVLSSSYLITTPIAREEGAIAGREAALSAIAVQPAMEFRNMEIVQPQIRQGEPLTLTYTYDKRADCYPDNGEGEINFKFFKGSVINGWRPGMRSDEPPGVNLPALNVIDTPKLDPGVYDLGLRAIFVCKGERAAQIITLPPLSFEVLP